MASSGDSPQDACGSLLEAIALVIKEDRALGLDPSDRGPAPPDCWEPFFRVQQNGYHIEADELNQADAVLFAGTLRIAAVRVARAVPAGACDMPPPFMISALRDGEQDGQQGN